MMRPSAEIHCIKGQFAPGQAMQFEEVAPATVLLGGRSLFDAISSANLTANLQFCLDAGDIVSFPGSGDDWVDLSAASQDFHLGPDATTSGAEPDFEGTAGDLSSSEYFRSLTADFCRMKGAIPSWVDALHQNGAAFSLLAAVHIPTSGTGCIFGNGANSTANPAIEWRVNSNVQRISVYHGSGVALGVTADSAPSTGAWHIAAVSIDEAAGAGGGFHYLDGSYAQVSSADTFDATYGSPSASGANHIPEIFAAGNGQSIVSANTRCAFIAGWSAALSKADIDNIYTDQAVKGRFGL